MARCDLCGNNCAAHMLETLPDFEQAAGVADICPNCTQRVAKIRRDLVATPPAQMRQSIRQLKRQPPTHQLGSLRHSLRRFLRGVWT
jgi:hypothetical protein